jgi:MFS family permease
MNLNVGALAVYTAGGLFWAFMPFFVGLHKEAGQLSQSQAGLLGSAYLIGFTAASVSALWWASRLNWRNTVFGAAGMVILGIFAMSQITYYFSTMIAVALIGLAMGAMWSIAYRVFASSPNPDRSFAFGIGISYCALAATIFFIGHYIIGPYGLLGAEITLSVLVLVLVLGAFKLPAGTQNVVQNTGLSLRPPLYVALGLFGILTTSLAFAAIWTFAERIGGSAGFDNTAITPVISSNLLFTAFGSALAVLLGTKVGRFKAIFIGLSVMSISIFALLNLEEYWVYAVAISALGLGIGFVLPFQMSLIATLDEAGQFVMLIAAAQGIGSALGPASAGLLADQFGAAALIFLTLFTLLVSVISYIFINLRPSHAISISLP